MKKSKTKIFILFVIALAVCTSVFAGIFFYSICSSILTDHQNFDDLDWAVRLNQYEGIEALDTDRELYMSPRKTTKTTSSMAMARRFRGNLIAKKTVISWLHFRKMINGVTSILTEKLSLQQNSMKLMILTTDMQRFQRMEQIISSSMTKAEPSLSREKEHPNLNKSVVSSFYSIKQSIVQW